MTIESIPFGGWANNLRLGNGEVQLVITLDVGPRILSYAKPDGINPFKIVRDQAGGTLEPRWRMRGGHRFWVAPESTAYTYAPDNAPVKWEKLGKWGVRLTPPPETDAGFQKQIDVSLTARGTRARIVHRLTRIGKTAQAVAPWALSVMAAGGVGDRACSSSGRTPP